MGQGIYKEQWREELADPAIQERREAAGRAEQEMFDFMHIKEEGIVQFIRDLLEEQAQDDYLTEQFGGPEGEAAYLVHMEESQYEGPHSGDLYRVNGQVLATYVRGTTVNQIQDPTNAWVMEVVGTNDSLVVVPFYGDEVELVECRHGLDELDMMNQYDNAIPYEV
jgi:hypothetical protein